jgi:RNA polymerase sigma-70 factor, ECF subfamily
LTSRQPFVQSGGFQLEDRWVALAKRGDTSAFNELVATYQDLSYNVAYRLVGDPDVAADVTQDAFWSAYRHLDQFHGGSFRSWLLRIVTNTSYDALRKRQRQPSQSLDRLTEETPFDPPDLGELPEALAIRQELFSAIESGLQTLPLDQRAVLVLCDVHGLSYEEAAVTLNTQLGTIKSRLSRARLRLRDYLLGHPELWKV